MMPAIDGCLPMPQSWRPLSLLRVTPFACMRGQDRVCRIGLPAFLPADIERRRCNSCRKPPTTKQDQSTPAAVRLGDRGRTSNTRRGMVCVARQANRSTQSDTRRSILLPGLSIVSIPLQNHPRNVTRDPAPHNASPSKSVRTSRAPAGPGPRKAPEVVGGDMFFRFV